LCLILAAKDLAETGLGKAFWVSEIISVVVRTSTDKTSMIHKSNGQHLLGLLTRTRGPAVNVSLEHRAHEKELLRN
jgi:hypothetical protein